MKAIAVLLSVFVVFGLVGCNKEIAKQEKAKMTKTKQLFVTEVTEKINIPSKYKYQLHLLNADDKYLYFEHNKKTDKDRPPWRTFRISRKDGAVAQYPLVRSDGAKFMRGYNGKMYIGLIDETRWTYEIVGLDVDGTKDILYKRKIDDIPMSMSSGNKQITVITHVNDDGEEFQKLEVLDLDTHETVVLDKSKNVPSSKVEGLRDGTKFMGFDFAFDSASPAGFCYEKCNYSGENENTEYGGKNKAYYYSFETGEKTRLEDPVGSLEYINGDPQLYLTSTFGGGLDKKGNETDSEYGEADMFVKKDDKYERVSFNNIIETAGSEAGNMGTMRCGGMLGENNVLFANSEAGFFVVEINALKYFHGSFRSDDEDLEDTVYQDFVGDSYDNTNQRYSFLTRDKTKEGHKYVLHTLSGE